MADKYYSNDSGIDRTDQATDGYLLGEALRDDGDAFAGYYGPVEVGDSWTRHPLSPEITELKIRQRRHRVSLLVYHFRPRTRAEAEARAKAIERYYERTE
ncbi:hypothetical protein MKK64_06030 [Methylobacterium sp. E-025]|uniref:hypothetical protein n=1 Tax=Methylobacterium sp. E-025 TaxID=2836561 RepID=UPI001FBB8F5A|nr:hypothetical protein [Methylobacterium sp. E-025]MCJ2110757.1 hypothetical protein [Methylobacterium sp. E-025]